MKLVQTIKELQSELDALRSEGKTIGLVPTMGALHAGAALAAERRKGGSKDVPPPIAVIPLL